MSIIVLVIAVTILLSLIVGGLMVIVLSERVERSALIAIVAASGLAILILGCIAAGLAFFLAGATMRPAPAPRLVTPTAVPAPLGASAQVDLIPERATIEVGESIPITIHIANATGLYGVEVHLTYDEGLHPGQLISGTCANDFIAISEVADNEIRFAATRVAPNTPASDDCDVATLTLTGEAPGTYTLVFNNVLLADRNGNSLPAIATEGIITVVPNR